MIRIFPMIVCLTIFTFVPSLSFSQESGDADVNVWVASFEMVWQTVHEHHYDSTFGGLDWKEIHDRYYKLICNVDDDSDFITLANKMLAELKLSHYAVFHMKEYATSGSPLISGGSIGLDTRLLDNKVVITSVKPDFPAAEHGLKPGYLVESIDGIPVEQIIADFVSDSITTSNERKRLSDIADRVNNRFFGNAETSISLTFSDASNLVHEVKMLRKQRKGKTIIDESLPPFYVDFQTKHMEDNIVYVSFSAFLPPVDEFFSQMIDTMGVVNGLIIDIRGNPGGMHEVGEAIASKLLQEETLFSVFRYRNETQKVVVQPSEKTYDGPVVVMIDVMNASASERFSACIQSVGRAVIIGERSSGTVGPSDVIELPNGASFMYLIAQSLTPGGTVLEGHGVIPDIVVELDAEALLDGRDTQLERAVEYIGQVVND